MPLLTQVEDMLDGFLGVRFGESDDSKAPCVDIIRGSRRSLYVVAGELDPAFYCHDMASLFEKKLNALNSYKISILFYKTANREEMLQRLCRENSGIVKLFLDEKYKGRIALYWASKRPRYHFIVADDSTYLEKVDHEMCKDREVYLRERDHRLADNYRSHFERMVGNPVVIPLSVEEVRAALSKAA